jgi:hypothetical protein
LGIFKTTVRGVFGPHSKVAVRILDTASRLRRNSTDRFLDPPVPLFIPEQSMLVIWSAKCASSLTFIWYLSTLGLLNDLLASGLKPHVYRAHRLPQLSFRPPPKMLDDTFIVHVVRDPYLRTVSSYRQMLATGYADKRLGSFEGERLDRQTGFSFSRFLDYLETIDLARANIHHKLQRHRIEEVKCADRVINISKQNPLAEFNRLERERGMRETDFVSLRGLLESQDERPKATPFPEGDVTDLRLNANAALGLAPWPDYRQFLNTATRRRIKQLYAPDFDAFGDYF